MPTQSQIKQTRLVKPVVTCQKVRQKVLVSKLFVESGEQDKRK